MKSKLRFALYLVIGSTFCAMLVYAFLPSPVKVDAARAVRGPLRVTIDEEGKTRIHDVFTITTPVAGKLARIELHEGDSVNKQTVIARIEPLPLEPREREELKARVNAAASSSFEALTRIERAKTTFHQTQRNRERAEELAEAGLISQQELEVSRNAESTAAREVEEAKHRADAAAFEVEIAKAGLLAIEPARESAAKTIIIRSPSVGRILRIREKSERVVSAGSPIVDLGDPSKIEIVADILSSDAVKIKSGDKAIIEGWGGDYPLYAKVRTVEPGAFTKVSALGIEEQRVNAIADFIDSDASLGDGYRVEVKFVVWESENALKIPSSSLFRNEQKWNVFTIIQDIAHLREVKIGKRSETETEIVGGLSEGEIVILHPSNRILDGSAVEIR